MKEYTLLSTSAVLIVIFLDNTIGLQLLKKREYQIFLGIMFLFKLIVNGFLTAYIVMYNSQHFLGIRLGTIPLEDFGFGFAMLTLTISLWEKLK